MPDFFLYLTQAGSVFASRFPVSNSSCSSPTFSNLLSRKRSLTVKKSCLKSYWLFKACLISVIVFNPLAFATDYNDGIPPSDDFKWVNLNLMYA